MSAIPVAKYQKDLVMDLSFDKINRVLFNKLYEIGFLAISNCQVQVKSIKLSL